MILPPPQKSRAGVKRFEKLVIVNQYFPRRRDSPLFLKFRSHQKDQRRKTRTRRHFYVKRRHPGSAGYNHSNNVGHIGIYSDSFSRRLKENPFMEFSPHLVRLENSAPSLRPQRHKPFGIAFAIAFLFYVPR